MRTWGLHKGHFIAIDSRKLSTEENDFQYETKIFKCNSKGQIRDWNDLYSLQYKHEKKMRRFSPVCRLGRIQKTKRGRRKMNLNEIAKEMCGIAEKRAKNGAFIKTDTMALLKHTATEVIEATEAYINYIYEGINEKKSHFASELADIIACVLIIAHKEEIDIEQALKECVEKNKKRAELKGDKK